MFWTYVIYRPTSAEIFEPCHRLESLSYEITMARPHGRDGFSRGCDEARLRVTTFCPFLGGSKSSQIKFSNRSMWKMMWQDWKTMFFVKKNVIVSDLLFCVYVSICLSIYLSIYLSLFIYLFIVFTLRSFLPLQWQAARWWTHQPGAAHCNGGCLRNGDSERHSLSCDGLNHPLAKEVVKLRKFGQLGVDLGNPGSRKVSCVSSQITITYLHVFARICQYGFMWFDNRSRDLRLWGLLYARVSFLHIDVVLLHAHFCGRLWWTQESTILLQGW